MGLVDMIENKQTSDEPFYCQDKSYHKLDRCKSQCEKCIGIQEKL